MNEGVYYCYMLLFLCFVYQNVEPVWSQDLFLRAPVAPWSGGDVGGICEVLTIGKKKKKTYTL